MNNILGRIKMGLRAAQRGYRYQDFLAAKIVCAYLIRYKNPDFRIDEKDNPNDSVEDIKVLYDSIKDCYQIKYTTTNRELSFSDLSNSGELSLEKLSKYVENEETECNIIYALRWNVPSDGLQNYLVEDSNRFLDFSNAAYLKYDESKHKELAEKINIEYSKELCECLKKIHIICNLPNASLDLDNPDELETNLLNDAKTLGIGKFPNEKIKTNQFIINLFSKLNYYRTASDFIVSSNKLLNDIGIVRNYGRLSQIPVIDKNVVIDRFTDNTELEIQLLSNEKSILIGDPGSGKTYLCNEFIELLKSKELNYSLHYLFIGLDDMEKDKRLDSNYVIGNIISKIYEAFPTIRDRMSYAANIDILNEIIQKITNDYYIVIDGIDHAYREYNRNKYDDIKRIVSKIVTTSYVHVILLSQNIDFSNFTDWKIIKMPNWGKKEIEKVAERLNIYLDTTKLDLIFNKSDGNPLYTVYLLRSNQEIENIPSYDGNIKNYYEYLISGSSEFSLFQYLAQIPFYFTEEEYAKISNSGEIAIDFIRKNSFLLKYDNVSRGYRPYHESFIRFIYDYCQNKKIDLNKTLKDIAEYLKTFNFYSNDKSYNNLLLIEYQLNEFDYCCQYAKYDFIFHSVYHGRSSKEITSNLEIIKKAIHQISSYSEYSKYLLVKRITDMNYDSDFLVSESPEYFVSLLNVIGQEGLNRLLNTNIESKTKDLICYSAYLLGLSVPSNVLDSFENYSQFERNYPISILTLNITAYNDMNVSKDAEISIEESLEIVRTLKERNALNKLKTNNFNVQLAINALHIENKCNVILDFDFDYDLKSTISKMTSYLVKYVSYISGNLFDTNVYKKVAAKSNDSFIFSLFLLICNNKRALEIYNNNKNQGEFETKLLENIETFEKQVEPFKGNPRACDYDEYLFKLIFVCQLLEPLKYIKNKTQEYFENIILIKNKLETSVDGYKMSCISLDDVLDLAPFYMTQNNEVCITSVLENEIKETLKHNLYIYSAGYYFKLSNMIRNLDVSKSLDYYSKGIEYSICYGGHKDIFFEEALDMFGVIYDDLGDKNKASIELTNMAHSLSKHTDGRETSNYYVDVLKSIIKNSNYGIITHLTNCELSSGYYWAHNEVIGSLIETIYKKIDIELLYYFLMAFHFNYYDFDFNVYIYAIDELARKNDYIKANRLFNYVYAMRDYFINDVNYVSSFNSLLNKYDFNNRKTGFVVNKRQENNTKKQKVNDCWNNRDEFFKSNLQKYIKIDYNDDSNKNEIIDFVYDNCHISEFNAQFAEKILEKEWDEYNYIFLNVLFFVILQNGWGKYFIHKKYYINAYERNSELTKKFFFYIISRIKDPFSGVAKLGEALYPYQKDEANLIWEYIYDITKRRIVDCYEILKEDSLICNDNLNVSLSKLLLSFLNENSLEMYKVVSQFLVDEVVDNKYNIDELASFIFDKWNEFKIRTKLDIIKTIVDKKLDVEKYISIIDNAISNDKASLSRIMLKAILKKQTPTLKEFKYVLPTNKDDIFAYLYLFDYKNVFNFFASINTNCHKILDIFKFKNNECQKDYESFYSKPTKRIIENDYIYNKYLESIQEFVDEIGLNDNEITILAYKLISYNPLLFNSNFDDIECDDKFVMLIEYSAEEIIEEEYKRGIANKHIVIKKYYEDTNDIVINNLEAISNNLLRDKMIEFTLSFELQNKYKITKKCINDQIVYFSNNGMIGMFIKRKDRIYGLDNYFDNYYCFERGKFLITKEFLDILSSTKDIKEVESVEKLDICC